MCGDTLEAVGLRSRADVWRSFEAVGLRSRADVWRYVGGRGTVEQS